MNLATVLSIWLLYRVFREARTHPRDASVLLIFRQVAKLQVSDVVEKTRTAPLRIVFRKTDLFLSVDRSGDGFEALLAEMLIDAKGLPDPVLSHQLEAHAIHKAEFLAGGGQN